MADNVNSMQAQLGLLSGQGGSFSPVGVPTPAGPMFQVKSPGQVSQELMQQAQQASMVTLQTTAAMRPGGMGASPISAFSQQYQQNMGAIQSQYMNPFNHQGMGMQGFNQGMMPSPAMMSSPQMGIFRNFPQGAPSSIPPVHRGPLFPTPFTPQMPLSHFQTPYELQGNMMTQVHQQRMAAAMAVPGVAARAGVDIGAGMLGSGVGALLGSRFGAGGARIGGMLGMGLGVLGSEMGGFGATAQGMVDNMNPMHAMSLRAQQLRGMSTGFVSGGNDLDPSGRGLSQRGAMQLSRGIGAMASDSGFQASTGNRFSSQDLTRITQLAGENGMLDMAQSGPQILDKVKTVAKSLKAFMQIAGQPDIGEAMKTFGQLKSMGMNFGEMNQFMKEAQMYSRMSGTSVSGIMESGGLQGAMTFQQQGLSAGLGMRMGVGAYGQARAMVGGGAFNDRQLAMLGGTSGVAQREMESNLAMLKQPMMAAAMMQFGKGGTFGLNSQAMGGLAGGKMNIGDMASMGANNLLGAVSKGGVGALGMFQAQQSDLQDQMGRALGPVGTSMMTMQQVMKTAEMMGLGKGPGALVTAAKAMGLDDKAAMQLLAKANSPGGFKNMRRQLEVQRVEERFAQRERTAEEGGGFLQEAATDNRGVANIRGALGDFGASAMNIGAGISDFISSDLLTSRGRDAGMVSVRTPGSLKATDDELRQMRSLSAEDEAAFDKRFSARQAGMGGSAAMFITPDGRQLGRNSLMGNLRNNLLGGNQKDLSRVRAASGGLGAIFGGGLLETGVRMSGLGHFMMNGEEMESRRADLEAGSQSLVSGLFASASERDDALNSVAKSMGGNKVAAATASQAFSSALAKAADAKHEASTMEMVATPLAALEKMYGNRGQLSESEIRGEFDKLVASGQIPKDADYEAFKKSSLVDAKRKAKLGKDGFAPMDMTSAEKLEQGLATAEDIQKEEAAKLFGEKQGWGDAAMGGVAGIGMKLTKELGGGDDDRRNKLTSALFANEDPRVAALTALRARAKQGDPAAAAQADKLAASLSAEGRQDLVDEAEKLSVSQRGNEDLLAGMGGNLVGKSTEEITEAMRGARDTNLLLKKKMDTDGPGLIGGLISGDERSINKAKEMLLGTEAEAAAFTPQSAATFNEGAKMLLDAATRLGALDDING